MRLSCPWLPDKPEIPIATWEDCSNLYHSRYYQFTVSDTDHVEISQIYCNETAIPANAEYFQYEFMPLTFRTSFYIRTHQGNKLFNLTTTGGSLLFPKVIKNSVKVNCVNLDNIF